MCGRIWALKPAEDIMSICSCGLKRDTSKVRPSYNAGPLTKQHIVVAEVAEEASVRVLTSMQWGFRDLFSQRKLLLNARYENLATYYRKFLGQRCVLVADGYFEWKDNKPYAVKPVGEELLFIAALFRENEGQFEFSVITVPCCTSMQSLHERQPALLELSDFDTWLDPSLSFESAKNCLKAQEANLFEVYEVPPLVSSIKANSAECLMPAQEYRERQKREGIGRYFQPLAHERKEPQDQKRKKPL